MLIDTVLIVLRETLEAGVVISMMLVIIRQQQLGLHHLFSALALGLVGAVIYAGNLRAVSEWFDYTGQEVVNACLQYAIFAALLMIVTLLALKTQKAKMLLALAIQSAIALALTREGAELIILYSGYIAADNPLASTILSGFLGLGIGSSVGVLIYYLLRLGSPAFTQRGQALALSLIACGMVVQGTQLMIQADWLSANAPLWDSNWLLAESSVLGQLCYALIGYESTPSSTEAAFYLGALALCFAAPFAVKKLAPFIQVKNSR